MVHGVGFLPVHVGFFQRQEEIGGDASVATGFSSFPLPTGEFPFSDWRQEEEGID